MEHARALMSVFDGAPPVDVSTSFEQVKVVVPLSGATVGLFPVPSVLVMDSGRLTPLIAQAVSESVKTCP